MDGRQHSALVSGSVSDRSGTPVGKGTAVLWKDGRGSQHPFNDGRYVIAVNNAGKYRIDVKGPGFAKASYELQIEEGKVYRKDFTLAPGGVIKGKVVDAAGRALQEGDVFYRDGNTSFGVPLDTDGTYRIEGLAPGQYKVTVTAGEKSYSQQVQVEAGKERVQDFMIK
jgi:hypothetical protein